MNNSIRLFGLALFFIGISSCVSKKKYNELGQQYENLEYELVKSQKKTRELKKELALREGLDANSASIPTTTIRFDTYVKDFGKVDQETSNKHVFTFTNTGNQPFLIVNAKGSCGCTVPIWPREPIPPGESGTIEVNYSPKDQQGLQSKTVTITGNSSPENTILTIKADVLKP